MHELSLCHSILDIVTTHFAGMRAQRVKKIVLELGELRAVDSSALLFSFDIVCKRTIAEGALLDIIVVEGQASCGSCQQTVRIKRYYDACPSCGNFTLTVTHGEELRVKSMEVV